MTRALLTALTLLLLPAVSQAAPPCTDKAVSLLKQYDADGYAVYKRSNKAFFAKWINCSLPNYSVGAAVHESVHMLGRPKVIGRRFHYRYYRPDGTRRSAPALKLFPRSEVADDLKEDEKESYVETYLTGPSGSQDIGQLLDELNAYTFGLITATRLAPLNADDSRRISNRDGLLSIMYFVELYLRRARLKHPKDFKRLVRAKLYGKLLAELWPAAEAALVKSAPHKNLGIDDHRLATSVYAKANLAELTIFGKAAGVTIAFDADLPKKLDLSPRQAGGGGKGSGSFISTGSSSTVTVNGKTYKAGELEKAAKTDPKLRSALRSLKKAGLYPPGQAGKARIIGGRVVPVKHGRRDEFMIDGRRYFKQSLRAASEQNPRLKAIYQALYGR